MNTRPFTGRHLAAIMIAFFVVVIAVNVFMARQASATFGGIVVENSYVASQKFNRWLDEASSERARGWHADLARRGDGRLVVSLEGENVSPRAISAVARHPLGRQPDISLRFVAQPDGGFVSTRPLPDGRWRVRIEVQTGDGTPWRSEGDVK
jgi:nitrogen fixation protein FixH